MIPIYIAESTLDAQLVQDLLASSGITAFVLGPNAAGAIPEVPPTHVIRVVVEDAEAEQARQLVQDWETGPGDEDEAFDLADSFPLQEGAV